MNATAFNTIAKEIKNRRISDPCKRDPPVPSGKDQ